MKKVLAISGSTRKQSINHALIRAIRELAKERMEIELFDDLTGLPHFNPDDDGDDIAEPVLIFREKLDQADGVVICTPEYAHGVPGSLKNAIDWTVSTSQFPNKPTLLITAATDGSFGHKALLETLRAIQAKNIDRLQMVIPFVKTKVSPSGRITDEKTMTAINLLLAEFEETMNHGQEQ